MSEANRNRGQNWSRDSTLFLVSLIRDRKEVIEGRFSPTVTSKTKTAAWKVITEKLNSSTNEERAVDVIMKKWRNLKQLAKKEGSEYHSAVNRTGGGPGPKPLSPITEAVLDVLGRDNVGVAGIPHAVDSTAIQLATFVNNDQSLIQEPLSPLSPLLFDEPSTSNVIYNAPASPDTSALLKQKLKLEIETLKLKQKYYELKVKKLTEE